MSDSLNIIKTVHAFNDDKTKTDIIILEYVQVMTARQAYTEYIEILPNIVDDIDNFVILSVSQFNTKGSRNTGSDLNAWFNHNVDIVSDFDSLSSYSINAYITPYVAIYSDGGVNKIKFGIHNRKNGSFDVPIKIRVALLRIG